MSNELLSVELWCNKGRSDKLYRVVIVQSGEGYVVNFGYGRRGTALNTGTKTSVPVTYDEARSVYSKLVQSKIAKGYTVTNGSGEIPGPVVAEADRVDTGLRPQLLNPVTEAEAEGYLRRPQWCAQEKYDGRRLLVKKMTDGTLFGANRKGERVSLPSSIEAQLADLAGGFVLDGELVGEVYHVFDLLEVSGRDWRPMPYRARYRALQGLIGGLGGTVLPVPTASGFNKHTLIKHLRSADKEGVVFKDLDAPWSEGRPVNGGSQLKCKFWASCACVVSGINAKRSIQVALDGIPMGNVTIPPRVAIPAVGQVVEVRYLYVTGTRGSLYQPTYLGVREDVDASECTVLLQRIKYKPVVEAA